MLLTLILEDLKLLSIVVSAASAMGKVSKSPFDGSVSSVANEVIGTAYYSSELCHQPCSYPARRRQQ